MTPQFTGKERDQESGLDYFHARYFSGPLGRFTSVDPDPGSMDITNPQSINRYAYVLGSPLSNVDPTGMDTITNPCAGNPNCVSVTAQHPGLDPIDEMLYRNLQQSGFFSSAQAAQMQAPRITEGKVSSPPKTGMPCRSWGLRLVLGLRLAPNTSITVPLIHTPRTSGSPMQCCT